MTDAEYIKRLKLVGSLNTHGVENTEECKAGHAIETLINLSSQQCIQNIVKFVISMYTLKSNRPLEHIKYLHSTSGKQLIKAIFQGEVYDCTTVQLRRDSTIKKIPFFKNGLLTFNGNDYTLQFGAIRIPHISDIWIHSKLHHIMYRTAGRLNTHCEISVKDGMLTVKACYAHTRLYDTWLRII